MRDSFSKKNSSEWKGTATDLMHSSDVKACWKKCCIFWFQFEVKCLTHFGVVLDLFLTA